MEPGIVEEEYNNVTAGKEIDWLTKPSISERWF